MKFNACVVQTPLGHDCQGLFSKEVCAIVVLRGGAAFETALKRIIPDCRTGRMLIQSHTATGEPALHYLKLPHDIESYDGVLLLDAQMSGGGSALMAIQVLLDHGVTQNKVVFVTYTAGKAGLHRLTTVFPDIIVVVCNILSEAQPRWVEGRYFRC
jgi:uridine kinase